MKKWPLVTLLSDFGLRDSYVAEMKAVILGICQRAIIVDISHEVEKYNVRMGAYILARAAPFFPEGTVHVAVVDPSVGTQRRSIIVTTKRSMYVGPDNGLLMLSAQKEKISHIYSITNSKFMQKNVSNTFHGRDIFSPVAAYLIKGIPASRFGPEIMDPCMPIFFQPTIFEQEIHGEAIYIDCFGNIITNITKKHLDTADIKIGDNLSVTLKEKIIDAKMCSTYGEVSVKTPIVIIGSSGFLELAINQGDASKILDVKAGDKLSLKIRQK